MDSCAIAYPFCIVYGSFALSQHPQTDPATTFSGELKCVATLLPASVTFNESSDHKYAGVVYGCRSRCSSAVGMRLEGTDGGFSAGFHQQ